MGSLKSRLKRHKKLYVALDRDEAGSSKREKVAAAFGPMTRLVDYAMSEAEEENNEAINEE